LLSWLSRAGSLAWQSCPRRPVLEFLSRQSFSFCACPVLVVP
jgi:hypothetical protein